MAIFWLNRAQSFILPFLMSMLVYGPARLAAKTCEPVSSKQLSVHAQCEIFDNLRNVILTCLDFRSSLRLSYDRESLKLESQNRAKTLLLVSA